MQDSWIVDVSSASTERSCKGRSDAGHASLHEHMHNALRLDQRTVRRDSFEPRICSLLATTAAAIWQTRQVLSSLRFSHLGSHDADSLSLGIAGHYTEQSQILQEQLADSFRRLRILACTINTIS